MAACKIVLLLAGLLLGLHALSCGLLFCIRLPWTLDLPHDVFKEVHGLYGLSGTLATGMLSPASPVGLLPVVVSLCECTAMPRACPCSWQLYHCKLQLLQLCSKQQCHHGIAQALHMQVAPNASTEVSLVWMTPPSSSLV